MTDSGESLTEEAVRRWGTAHPPRMAELMTGLVRHLHAFAREVDLTTDEWMTAMDWLTRTGRISDDKRQEFILASDVLGLSSLVVQLDQKSDERATPATVLGPFHIDGSPVVESGFDMSEGLSGTPLFIVGRVTDLYGRPVPSAVLDVWQADVDGAYESQLADIDEARLRAQYRAGADGKYCVRTIAPLGYTIPMDGPVGELISRTGISPYRPAHIHFLVDQPGYRRLVTHLFPAGTDHLDSDVVFGVKDALVTPFVEYQPGPGPDGTIMDRPFLVTHYDFVLAPASS
ncbi:dioxygenase family protein [Paractinoplanes brasiliensis]|uniref:Hydroxyquinol 1,2-dioxygenase n=1 Tax=Paractinoplanes brasiliensis TaxID=52695 RepID=A0A4V3C7C0_9ACTN|nr:dioxygenase [Actinoplanes brasiliensis]TDO37048.1 hydroxyquinol 1,2-dioxygenase [Actinoplanes brasiliensis]GID32258.1 catechol 1,2-dioxygenase [Actinoplanes brasiliensis]